MNKETICYLALGIGLSLTSVLFRNKINPTQVANFVNSAQTSSNILKAVSEPFMRNPGIPAPQEQSQEIQG